jgi:hypothetical protein
MVITLLAPTCGTAEGTEMHEFANDAAASALNGFQGNPLSIQSGMQTVFIPRPARELVAPRRSSSFSYNGKKVARAAIFGKQRCCAVSKYQMNLLGEAYDI